MKKIILFLLAILYVGICKAQLSAADCKYVLEIFCRNYYGSCFDGKTYVPNTIIITSVGIDQNSGGTFVSGLHSYQATVYSVPRKEDPYQCTVQRCDSPSAKA